MCAMDLTKLRTFIAVARAGNLTRAANTLCLSQPAVSAQLKALEKDLGLQLFERVARGMELTEAGKALVEEAEQAITAVRQVSNRAQSLRNGIAGEIRIGTIATPSILRLEQTVSLLTARHPNLRLSLVQGISGDVIDWILEDEIEAGYVIGQPEDVRVEAKRISPVTLRVVAPSAWAERIHSLDWSGISALPWISTPAKCSFSSLSSRMFTRHGVRPQTAIEADQEHTLRSLVASGAGLTLLREDVAMEAQSAGEAVIWEPGAEVSHVYFVYRREKVASSRLQEVLRIIEEVWDPKAA